jgi:hypothetical protein
MIKTPVTLEAQYISKTVGPQLSRALAEIIHRRPTDPVEYLGNYLIKYVDNKKEEETIKKENELIIELQKKRELDLQREEEKRKEVEALRQFEEEMRREKEERARKAKEAEELARRKENIAKLAPALPSLSEEDENNIVEFGQTKLHEAAGLEGANLAAIIKENFNIASRNGELKTARDIAVETNQLDNVKQIDDIIFEWVQQEDYKQLSNLVLLGFNLTPILIEKYESAEKMIESGLKNQADHLFNELPALEVNNNLKK